MKKLTMRLVVVMIEEDLLTARYAMASEVVGGHMGFTYTLVSHTKLGS